MSNPGKAEAVQQMNEAFAKTPHVILATFRGLTVNQVNELRGKVAEAGGSYTVVKNRLARLAAPGTAVEQLAERLSGPCALATHESDPVGLAKTLSGFATDNPELELVAAVIEAQELVDAAGLKIMAQLPGLPELRAQLLALVQTPATMLVRLLGEPGSQMARVVAARRDQLEES